MCTTVEGSQYQNGKREHDSRAAARWADARRELDLLIAGLLRKAVARLRAIKLEVVKINQDCIFGDLADVRFEPVLDQAAAAVVGTYW